MGESISIVNDWAPEHLILVAKNEDKWLDQVRTAGAIYVGNYSAVAVGDFLAGPSHTLPTEGSGRSFSGLRADQFQRRASVVRMDQGKRFGSPRKWSNISLKWKVCMPTVGL